MKLLFDQNLSHKLPGLLEDIYPSSADVRPIGLDRASDEAVWAHARDQGYGIVTQDADFAERSRLYGSPPKVVWLRCGNAADDRAFATQEPGNDRGVVAQRENSLAGTIVRRWRPPVNNGAHSLRMAVRRNPIAWTAWTTKNAIGECGLAAEGAPGWSGAFRGEYSGLCAIPCYRRL